MGAILLATACANRVSAAPLVTETVEYFDVSGFTPLEIRAELRRLGPTGADGRRYDGFTKWLVNWKFNYKNVSQGCAIAGVTTTVKATIFFPRLKTDTATPVPVKQAFAGFLEKLMLHEKGHVQNAIDIAKRIEDGIRALPAQSDCATLGRSANTLGDSLIKEANRMDLEYDARTNHGATQGVRFP